MTVHILRRARGRTVGFGLERWSPHGWRFGTTDVATDRHRMGWVKWRLSKAGLRWPERACPWMPGWTCRAFYGPACRDVARMEERGCWRWLQRARSQAAEGAPSDLAAVVSETERTAQAPAPPVGQLELSL